VVKYIRLRVIVAFSVEVPLRHSRGSSLGIGGKDDGQFEMFHIFTTFRSNDWVSIFSK
jgi:hypothetical protein